MVQTVRRAVRGRDSEDDESGPRGNRSLLDIHTGEAIMNNQNSNKRTSAGIKALIATASVAATIAGWSMLPTNDPASAAGTAGVNDGSVQPPASIVPSDNPSQGFDAFPTALSGPTSP